MPRAVPVRGVIEGFYGTPWSHAARLDMVEFLGAHDMNAYVYAPKDDEKHRARWREPYDERESADFAELASRCASCGVRFGFALSPGLDVTYGDHADREALMAKLAPLVDHGVDWFVLALDDIPMRDDLAREQAELTSWLLDAVLARAGDARLSVVPTEYLGTRPTLYLHELLARLPEDLDIMWTGPTVCAPRITADDARPWHDALGPRPLLLWDNYPVNDTMMSRELHLGPYRGRAPELTDVVGGVLCNPMEHPQASKVALAVAAEFLCAPEQLDEDAAWDRAIREVGASHADSLGALARACAYGPLQTPAELPARDLFDVLAAEMDGPGWASALVPLRDELTALRDAGEAWSDADPLGAELRPWTDKARLEAEAGLSALRLLQHLRPVGAADAGGTAKVAGPDAELTLIHLFAVLYAWNAVRDAGPEVVLGPRFAMHPAVIQLPDGRKGDDRIGVDVNLAVHEDGSVVDALCRLALDRYEHWTTVDDVPVRVMTANGELPPDADGTVQLGSGVVALVRCGPLVTRLVAPASPPFLDPRLS